MAASAWMLAGVSSTTRMRLLMLGRPGRHATIARPPRPLLVVLMRALARRQVPIQLGHILEDRHARKRLDNLENLLDLGLHMDERSLTAALLDLFARHGKDPQAGAADKLELGQIKYELFDLTGQHGREL